jgi:hypothetical protein
VRVHACVNTKVPRDNSSYRYQYRKHSLQVIVDFSDETPSKKRKLSLQKEENKGSKIPPTASTALGSASTSASSSSSSSSPSSSSAGCSKETEPDELSTPVEEQEDTDWLEVLEKTVTDLKESVEKKG